jgi:hypothetical protein
MASTIPAAAVGLEAAGTLAVSWENGVDGEVQFSILHVDG